MSWVVVGLVSFLSGLIGSLGMGGGAVLLLYLRVFAGYEQMAAQGINLLFFWPIGLFALVFHAIHKLVDWKTALVCILAGLPGALLGVWIAGMIGGAWLSKGFGVLLLVIGVRELFHRSKS